MPRPDDLVETLERPTAKGIRDGKVRLAQQWAATNGDIPCEIVVRRGFSAWRDVATATIICRAAFPPGFNWPEGK